MRTTNSQPPDQLAVPRRSLIHEPTYDADAERLLGAAEADSDLRFMHHELASATDLAQIGTIEDPRYAIDFRLEGDGTVYLVHLVAIRR